MANLPQNECPNVTPICQIVKDANATRRSIETGRKGNNPFAGVGPRRNPPAFYSYGPLYKPDFGAVTRVDKNATLKQTDKKAHKTC